MMHKRFPVLAAALFLISGAVAFAGGSKEKSAPASTPANTVMTANPSSATLNVEVQGGELKTQAIQDMVQKFEQQTGIHVNLIPVPTGSMTQKTLLDLKTNAKLYDVAMVPEDTFWEYAGAKYLASLGSVSATPAWLQGFIPAFASRVQYEGNWYGTPIDAESNVLYYNTKLFKDAGLDPSSPPQTWAEFLKDAQQLQAHGIDATGWLGATGNNATWNWADFLFSFGGNFFDSQNQPVFNSAQGVKSLEYVTSLINTYHVMPSAVTTWGYSQLFSAMEQGKIAMAITWPNLYAQLNDPSKSAVVNQVKIAPPPSFDGTAGVPGGEWKLIVPYDTPHLSAATQFVRYFSTSEFEYYEATKYGMLPARSSVYQRLEKEHPSYTWSVWNTVLSKDTKWMPVQHANWPTISNDISYAIQQVELQKASAQDALTAAAKQIQALGN